MQAEALEPKYLIDKRSTGHWSRYHQARNYKSTIWECTIWDWSSRCLFARVRADAWTLFPRAPERNNETLVSGEVKQRKYDKLSGLQTASGQQVKGRGEYETRITLVLTTWHATGTLRSKDLFDVVASIILQLRITNCQLRKLVVERNIEWRIRIIEARYNMS